jgi:hypothetical protein
MKMSVLSAQPFTPWGSHKAEFPPDFLFQENLWRSDIWVADKQQDIINALEESIQLNRKKPKFCILWTAEPYYSEVNQTKLSLYGVPVEIFNIWNGRALFHNGSFLEGKAGPKEKPAHRARRAQGRPIVALMTYPNTLNPYTGERVSVAKQGYERGLLDIYGKGWPDSIRKGNSRDGEWWKSKMPILDQYDYNLALENCIQPYYVTEKIWDPIYRNCLPIYADNGTIYQTFPRGSFLDVRDYSTTEKLWEHIGSLSEAEWNKRMDGCWVGLVQGWKDYTEKGWIRSIEEIQKVVEARK